MVLYVVGVDQRFGAVLSQFLVGWQLRAFANLSEKSLASILHADVGVLLMRLVPGQIPFAALNSLRRDSNHGLLCIGDRLDEADCLVAIEAGADDCCVNVTPRVLAARIRNLQSRIQASERQVKQEEIRRGDLFLDFRTREARCGDTDIDLTGLEFNLLWKLAQRSLHVVPRQDLVVELGLTEESYYSRALDVHICRLRHKIRNCKVSLVTLRGQGYQLVEQRKYRKAAGTESACENEAQPVNGRAVKSAQS